MDGAIISRPPDYGAQIGDPYVIHAHFEFLRRLLARCRTFRFYLRTLIQRRYRLRERTDDLASDG